VRTDPRGQRAVRAPTESLDPWDWLERRENWVFQDYQATREDKDPRARLDSQGSQEPMGRKEPGVLRANLVQGGKEVQRVHVVLGGQEVLQASQALRAQRATTVHLARLAREDLKDPRAPWASLDRRAPLDHLERTGCPDTLANAERRDSKGRRDHLVQEEWLGLRVLQEKRAPSEREDTPDPQGPPESRAFLVLVARREPRETLDPKEPLVKMVPLGFEDSPEREVFLARRVQPV